MDSLAIIVIGAAFSFGGGLLLIIYNNLNNKTSKNEDEIKGIKEKFVTKEDFNRQNDKVDAKLDKILDILMGGKHEK